VRHLDLSYSCEILGPEVNIISPFQSELTPKDGRAVDDLYERAKEQEKVEAVLSRLQADVLRERHELRQRRGLVRDWSI
jgi:hypothetical protein